MKKCFKQQRTEIYYKKQPLNPRNSNNNRNKRNNWKTNACFRCGSEDHFISNFLKLDTSDKKVHWNMLNPKTRAYRSTKTDKTPEISTDLTNPHKICVYMARMSSNVEIPISDFGDSSQLINWI